MGFIRTSLTVIVSILLLASLFFGNLFLTFAYSLEYENIEPEINDVVQEVVYENAPLEEIQNISLEDLGEYCKPHENFPLKTETITYTIPCEVIEKSSEDVKSFIFQNISKGNLNDLSKRNIEQQVEDNYQYMEDYCLEKEEVNYELAGEEISVPCNVSEEDGKENIVDYVIEDTVQEYYFKDYDCGFIDCFGNTGMPFFLVSEKARDYWGGLFWKTIFVSLVLFILLFLLVVKKTNSLIILGSLLILSSPLFISPSLLSGIVFNTGLFIFSLFASANFNSSLELISNSIISIGEIFLSEATRVFIKVFITGIIVLLIGITLGILEKSYNISGKIKEFVKRA